MIRLFTCKNLTIKNNGIELKLRQVSENITKKFLTVGQNNFGNKIPIAERLT